MYQGNDQLLYVVSARGEMTWNAFKDAFGLLRPAYLASDEDEDGALARLKTVRALDALGHCEFTFGDTNRVIAAPPVLARLPHAGPPRALLSGARVPQTVRRLEQACRRRGGTVHATIETQEGEAPLLPARIILEGGEDSDYEAIAAQLGFTYSPVPPAWALIHFADGVDDYLAALGWTTDPEPNWSCWDFSLDGLRWQLRSESSPPVRLSRYRNPVRHNLLHLFWEGNKRAEIDPDWGRYAVMRKLGQRILHYDPWRLLIAVPTGTPLPKLIARALALCSGLAPATMLRPASAGMGPVRPFAVYQEVPAIIAKMAAQKIGQQLEQATLDWVGGER